MSATVSTDWSLLGLQAVILDNDLVRVVVLPELGGKVWELHDLTAGRQLLWHNPRVRPTRVPFGSGYDDVFCGGWDELFPNDVPERLGGEDYPDHGETWSLPWAWEVRRDDGQVSVRLEVVTPISACRLQKTITLADGQRHLRVDHVVENTGGEDLPFLWKQHLAVAVDEGARIDMPAGEVLIGDFGRPRAGGPGDRYPWPHLVDAEGTVHDMRATLPSSSRRSELQYATALTDGWCSVTHADGTGLAVRFDQDVFRSCWTFASYGGWRDLQVVVLEPCTGYPISVAEGSAAGTHQVLKAGGSLTTSVTAVVLEASDHDTGVGADGPVAGGAS